MTFSICSTIRKDLQWLDEYVLPRLGGHYRKGQRFSEQKNKPLSDEKAKLTWATADRCLHVVARGSPEELRLRGRPVDGGERHRGRKEADDTLRHATLYRDKLKLQVDSDRREAVKHLAVHSLL